jgi:hypothetical protein
MRVHDKMIGEFQADADVGIGHMPKLGQFKFI